MAVYTYKALGEGGGDAGTVVADTPRHARDQLRGRGLTVISVAELSGPGRRRRPGRRAKRRYAGRVVEFVRELSTLLSVGIPLVEALDTLIRERRGRFRGVLLRVRDRISGGLSLAASMEEEGEVFDEMVVSISRVGERAGNLEEVLSRLADFKERSGQLRGRVANALIYPAIVLVMAAVISTLLMTFVVPNILEPLVESGAKLPAVTRVVKGASDLVLSWWWLLLSVLAALFFLLSSFLRTERGRTLWHRFQLRLPILGEMARKQAIVRISIVISTLLRSGIVFLEAVRIARRATQNRVFREALRACEKAVSGGQDIAESLERTRAFPPSVIQIFSVGQESGRLEEMLERLSADYDAQVFSAAQRFASILEPAMILLLSINVGVIAFATILPILEAGHVL